MNIIDERDKRTIYRKLRKKEYDDILTLSVSTGEKVRLLDEGTVVDAYGGPLFYIKKGVLKAFYDGLDESYVGSINIGHTDLATFPERIVGTWSKQDLELVDIGDGRQALNVNLKLMEEHPLVKALRLAPYSLGVSAEFGYHIDEEASNKYGLEILDGVNIYDFAIVGEAGNVNSSGIELKGGVMTTQKKLSEILGGEVLNGANLDELNKKLSEIVGETPEVPAEEHEEAPAEEPVAEPAEEPEAEEQAEEAPQEAEETPEEAEPEEVPTEEKEEAVDLSVVLAGIESLKAEVEQLKAQNEELKSKLAAKEASEKAFVEKFKNLSVSLTVEKKQEPVVHKPTFTDGIGE